MLLKKYGDRVLDFWSALALEDNSAWKPELGLKDGGHPNSHGHEALFKVVVTAKIPQRVHRK